MEKLCSFYVTTKCAIFRNVPTVLHKPSNQVTCTKNILLVTTPFLAFYFIALFSFLSILSNFHQFLTFPCNPQIISNFHSSYLCERLLDIFFKSRYMDSCLSLLGSLYFPTSLPHSILWLFKFRLSCKYFFEDHIQQFSHFLLFTMFRYV